MVSRKMRATSISRKATCTPMPKTGGSATKLAAGLDAFSIEVDSAYVYGNGSNGTLWKVPIGGGSATSLTSVNPFCTIGSDSTNLYYGYNNGLWQISKSGGTPTLLASDAVFSVVSDGVYVYWSGGSGTMRVPVNGRDHNFEQV